MITALTNTSGVTMHFGWIPPHGRTLTAGQQILTYGDLPSVMASGLNRYNRTREITALEDAIGAGDIAMCTYEVNPCTSSGSSLIP